MKLLRDRVSKLESGTASPVLNEVKDRLSTLENQMKKAAQNLEFERAAILRDEIVDLRKILPETNHGYQPVDMVQHDL